MSQHFHIHQVLKDVAESRSLVRSDVLDSSTYLHYQAKDLAILFVTTLLRCSQYAGPQMKASSNGGVLNAAQARKYVKLVASDPWVKLTDPWSCYVCIV